MTIATEIRPPAHVYASVIPICEHIWLKCYLFPINLTIFQLERSRKHIDLIGVLIATERDIETKFLTHFDRMLVSADCVSVVDDRHG